MASTDVLSSAHTGPWLAEVLQRLLGHPLPRPQFGELHFLVRKAGHLTEYGILGALLFRALRGDDARRWRWTWAAAAILIAACAGALDEFHQTFVPSRGPSPWDVLIDTAGAALAMGIVRAAQVLFFRS